MDRFFSASAHASSQNVLIDDPDELHHLKQVLRLKIGDEVQLVNGKGLLVYGTLIDASKQKAVFKATSFMNAPPRQAPLIVLACALPKKAKFEMILEKATELGVDEIIPMVTERTEVIVNKETGIRKEQRFSKVIVNACKQSKRLWFPELHPVMPFEDVIKTFNGDSNALFIPWLKGDRRHIREAFEEGFDRKMARIVFLIGPEGDFTFEEVNFAVKAGAKPLDLGETILKVDTAAVAVVSYAKFRLGR